MPQRSKDSEHTALDTPPIPSPAIDAEMWRRIFPVTAFTNRRKFSSSSSSSSSFPTSEIPTLYSFLQPSIFAIKKSPQPPPSPPSNTPDKQTLTLDKAALESDLQFSLQTNKTDEAWKSFKALTSNSLFPSKPLSNSLITHLSSLKDLHNLKRAFASAVLLLERSPQTLDFGTLEVLFHAMDSANTPAPAFALVKSMFKSQLCPPFTVWGHALMRICRKSGSFGAFLQVFDENCRVALEERLDTMKPDLCACNAALEGCCRDLGSVSDAERILRTMSELGLSPDAQSFGHLGYLYASKGLESRIAELDKLMGSLHFLDKSIFYKNLISGYVKTCDFKSVSEIILRALREVKVNPSIFGEEAYTELVRGYLENGRIKQLADLVIESQALESTSQQSTGIDSSFGFNIVNACVNLGWLDKAHGILDEMNARGASVGVGVYSSILKAYCKEHRTEEATQMVTEINASGLQLDAGSYDALIDASMASQDFQSAFSLFRDMREARLPDLKMSYLTIMTGLMENHRPELMASFLDSVVDDPRVEVATHDWNSIIHAFCKAGRLEDARRTYRRMVFLQFEPNEQTYLSLINGYVSAEKYFSILLLWTEVRRKGIKFDNSLVDAFLYALVKGGFFDAAMQVVEKAQELKIFINKWRHKQAFMETHKKLKVAKLRKRNFRKMEALVAFKNWAGLNV